MLAAVGASLHCVGMCGPLRVLAAGQAQARWLYQGGRLLTYFALGVGAGFLGAALPTWAAFLFLGLAILASLPFWPSIGWITKVRARLLRAASGQPFFLGVASGLLPCGLLHLWVAAAAATASPAQGAMLLLILWAGTLPALELGVKLLQPLLAPLRRRFPHALPIVMILLALVPVWARNQHAKSGDAKHSAGHSCH